MDEATKAGFTHPCNGTCSGYAQAAAEERERLAKLAPEFSEFECRMFDHKWIMEERDLKFIVDGARWQHAQLAPVIGALHAINFEYAKKHNSDLKQIITLREK